MDRIKQQTVWGAFEYIEVIVLTPTKSYCVQVVGALSYF